MRRIFIKDDRLRPIIRILLFAVLQLLTAPVAAIVARIAMLFGAPNPFSDPTAAGFYFTIVGPVVALGSALVLRRYVDRRSIESLGLALKSRALFLLGLGIVIGAAIQLPRILWASFHGSSVVMATSFAAPSSLGVSMSPLGVVIAIALSVIFMDVAARGYVLQNVWEEWGVLPAVIAPVLIDLFLSGQWFNGFAIYVVMLGACLGLSVIWTRSLWLCLGLHFATNLLSNPDGANAYLVLECAMVCAATAVLFVLHRKGAFKNEVVIEPYMRQARDELYV